jgi:hypothetical protein
LTLKVQFLRDNARRRSECWSFAAPGADLDAILSLAQEPASTANLYFEAMSFRILNETGRVLAEERIVPLDGAGPPFPASAADDAD